MKLLKSLMLCFCLLSLVKTYSITSSCYSCLSSVSPSNKFCISYDDAPSGYCCEASNSTDACSKFSRYLCSDLVQSKSMKLYMCPNQATKCYSTSLLQDYGSTSISKVIFANDQSQQLGGTTPDFGNFDTCGWHIIASTEYVRDKLIRITINSISNTNCYLNSGTNILNANGETTCSYNTEYDFDADQHVFIVA